LAGFLRSRSHGGRGGGDSGDEGTPWDRAAASALADPQTGAIIVSPDSKGARSVFAVIGDSQPRDTDLLGDTGLGRVWAIRAERFINESRPRLNCVLLFIGLYLTVQYLLTHLAWYGLASYPNEVSAAPPRGLVKLAICSLIIIAIFCNVCHRWVGRPPGESGKPQSV